LQQQADFTGRGDLLYNLTAGLRDNNDPEYLRQMVTDLNDKTQELSAAMERYGISWEQLGEKARQSKIDEMAMQFITDFKLLTDAGASTQLVIEKMSSSVVEFLQTAVRTGAEVPIAMQPMVLEMEKMGLLVDQNGQKLETSSINWSMTMTMTQGFQSVAEAINHLAQALGYELPQAARTAAIGINSELSRIQMPRLTFFRSEGDAEYVEPRTSDSGSVYVNVDATGSIVDPDMLSERIAERVAPFLPGVTDQYGV
jgi:hypothetical protein